MDSAYLSAVSALAGTVIGGVTSFATTWLTTRSQARAARLAAEHNRREDVYGRFMDELSAMYGGVLATGAMDYARLAAAFALRGRIMVMATKPVFDTADEALRLVVDLAMAPPQTDEEKRRLMDDARMDAISKFAVACRRELEELRVN